MNHHNEIETLRERIKVDALRLAELQKNQPPLLIENYELMTTDGPVKLSEFFQGRQDLIVIHNMGSSCNACTMVADGLNGVESHIHDRAAMLLVSADSAEEIEAFANERGWLFAVASGHGSAFTADMGFAPEDQPWPGVSTFHQNGDGQIERIAQDVFGPGDVYCSVWHLLARLKDGINDWSPKAHYPHDAEDDSNQGCGAGCGCHH
jgi:predicted dithiol-disulfide oxidoreductase (DUF899 family)